MKTQVGYYACKNYKPKQTPPTFKDVLLKTWAQDTEAMAKQTILSLYNSRMERYEIPSGTVKYVTRDVDDAINHYIAYLNSAAEGATK